MLAGRESRWRIRVFSEQVSPRIRHLKENIELSEYELILLDNNIKGNIDLYDVDDNYSSDDSTDSSNREYGDEASAC